MINYLLLIFFLSFFFFYFINDLINNSWELMYENLAYLFSLKTDVKNITQKDIKINTVLEKQFKRFSSNNRFKPINLLLKFHESFLAKPEDILKLKNFLKNYDIFLKNVDKNTENDLSNLFLSTKENLGIPNEKNQEDFEEKNFNEKPINDFSKQEDSNPPSNFSDFMSLNKGNIEVLSDTGVRFTDIAGNDSAKKEIEQIIDFLKNPEIYKRLGAEIPKGVLLGGPPGTGKTLFAKAIAGEAGVPFLKASGSEFVELLIGLGAARVRELFSKARSLQPCIVFIDEIDSVAKARSGGRNLNPGNDERDQTLNQLLVEMDGFEPSTGIIVIGATNRTNVLDPAIQRPGRFDRQIMLTYPSLNAREAILKVHSRNKKIAESVSIIEIAQKTAGFSGADIENLLNEAAILATRRKKKLITTSDIDDTLDKIATRGASGIDTSRMKLKLIRAFPEVAYCYLIHTFSDSLVLDKLTLVTKGKKKLKPSSKFLPSVVTQYQTKLSLLIEIVNLLSRFSTEKIVLGESELTTDRSRELKQVTSTLQLLTSEYGMANLRLLNLDPDFTSQQDFFTSDETRNINDNYSLDLINSLLFLGTYHIKNLMLGEERIVDELLKHEELDRFFFTRIANQYYSAVKKKDLLMELRKSLILKVLIKLNFIKNIKKK